FESAMKLHLPFGRLAAEVPPSAKGFTVVTPTGNAIDLGTRFGVDVPAQGHAEIHVFEGEVIAEPTKKEQRRSLLGGEAATLQAESEIPRDLRTAAFIQSEEVTALSAALAAGRQQHSDSAVSLL